MTCDISHSSSRAKINIETIMRRSTVLTKDFASSDIVNTQRKGFQHVYGSSTKPSSRRVKEAYSLSLRKGSPKSKLAVKRDKQTRKKIESLAVVSSSPIRLLCNSFFLSGKPLFFSGTRNTGTLLPICMTNAHVLSAVEYLKGVDTVCGARLTSTTGDTVFTLIPRHDAIKKIAHVKKTIMSLYALLEDAQPRVEIRGKTRVPVAEDDGKYSTECWPKNKRKQLKKNLQVNDYM